MLDQDVSAFMAQEHIQGLVQQSSKEEAKQKEMYQFKTKVSQNGKCKSKSSAKTFT